MLNFEKRLKEIKSKRDIISDTLPRIVSEKEEEEAHSWWTNHKCFLDENKWKPDIELGTLYPSIRLVPTSIGSNIYIECPFCSELKNVSDYETW